jgi:membrane protease YdiL (CAAX protease family)
MGQREMSRKISTPYLLLELILLFVIFPILYFFDLIPFHKLVPLVVLFIYCLVILVRHRPSNPERYKTIANWKLIILRFVGISILILVWIKIFSPNPLFADFKANKKLLLMTLVYPFSSAFPQELIFREFFFYRYKPIFQNEIVLIGMNVILFAFAHIYFANWTILIFTLTGGIIFALTYLKTKSLFVVTIEHTLFGMLILSSGLSEQFYKAF